METGKYWKTQEGEEIPYSELERGHLLNIIKFVERRAKEGVRVVELGRFMDELEEEEYFIKGEKALEHFDYEGLKAELARRGESKVKLTYTDEDKAEAQRLFDMGYRVVSRAFRIISRVDMSDYEMMEFFVKKNFGDRTSGLPCLPIEQQKDQYRRVYSEDKKVVRGVIMKLMKQLER